MAQFVAFAPGVEINGQTIQAFSEAMPVGREYRLEILQKHGIVPGPDQWFLQQAWLDAFREVAENVGEKTLFAIGKAIVDHAEFPPMVKELEMALRSIDVGYHMNHRGGEIGSYALESFDPDARHAVMVCENPYPSEFDRGIITAIVRRFSPQLTGFEEVKRDPSKPTRLDGADSCTYIITW